jgi:hypothetical protein
LFCGRVLDDNVLCDLSIGPLGSHPSCIENFQNDLIRHRIL